MVETYRPETLKEALELRRLHTAVPLAGGTDLMVRYRSWPGTLPTFPWPVLYVNHLKELQGIELVDKELRIGAAVTLTEVQKDKRVPTLLVQAVSQMAAPALRNLGTLAGNVCNASPAGDALCALYALDASVELASVDSVRTVAVQEFITGPGRKDLKDDELLTKIIIPLKHYNVTSYRKVGTRRANALSKMSFCALALVKNGMIDDLSVSFGAVGPTVIRSESSERALIGVSEETFEERSRVFFEDLEAMICPIDDQRSTAAYRKQVSLNLLEQFLQQLRKEL